MINRKYFGDWAHTLGHPVNQISRMYVQYQVTRGWFNPGVYCLSDRAFFLNDYPVIKAGHERKRRSGAIETRFNSDLISCLGHVFSWKRPEGAHVRWETVCLSRAKRVSGTTRARHESFVGPACPALIND